MAPAATGLRLIEDVIAKEGVGRTMTTESEHDSEAQGEFEPRGTVAFVAAFVVVLLLMWFSIYIIMLSRGTTI